MKVFASIMVVSRASATAPVLFQLSYTYLSGDLRSDHVLLNVGPFTDEGQLASLLKQGLADHLNAQYPDDKPLTEEHIIL